MSEMESPEKRLLRILAERDPASPEFRSEVRAALRPAVGSAELSGDELGMWRDVFVQQKLPWGRFLQSALLHAAVVALLWAISLAWIRQQTILDRAAFDRAWFDRSALVTYTPEEYLPPLDTGASEAAKAQKGNPVYAKQPILSVPREADNHSQTIVVPPDLKLDRDVALPNIIATGTIVPAVPLDATRAPLTRIVAPEVQVVAPAPDVEFAPDRVVRAAMKSGVIAPPPELTQSLTPSLTRSTKGRVGPINIGLSEVVAPAPQLTLTEQHSPAARGRGHLPGGGVQPVGTSSKRGCGGRRQGGWTADRVGNSSRRAHRTSRCSRRQPPGNIRRDSAGKTRRLGNAGFAGGRSRRRQL